MYYYVLFWVSKWKYYISFTCGLEEDAFWWLARVISRRLWKESILFLFFATQKYISCIIIFVPHNETGLRSSVSCVHVRQENRWSVRRHWHEDRSRESKQRSTPSARILLQVVPRTRSGSLCIWSMSPAKIILTPWLVHACPWWHRVFSPVCFSTELALQVHLLQFALFRWGVEDAIYGQGGKWKWEFR